MDASDVQRSRVVSHILNIYSDDENHKALLRSSQFQSDYFFTNAHDQREESEQEEQEEQEESTGTDDCALIPKNDVSDRYPLE